MKTETEAVQDATAWVKDQIERTTCISDDEAQELANGFVSGFLHGLRKGGQGQLVVQGDTAEAFWRGNWDAALAWDREHYMGIEEED